MNKQQFTLVLPIKINDHHHHNELERLKRVLLPTLIKFSDSASVAEFLIICKPEETTIIEKTIKSVQSPFPIHILSEDTLVTPEISQNCKGWYLQQIIKLAVVEIIKTDHYLVLDSDCFLTKQFSYNDLFCDGKIVMNCDENSIFSHWWDESLCLLEYPASILENKPRMGVTPEILISSVVRDLINYLNEKSGDWQQLLASNPFTEFTLYWLYCLKNDLTDNYQTTSSSQLLGNGLWTIEGRPSWVRLIPKKWRYSNFLKSIARQLLEKQLYIAFKDNENYHFSLIQSGIEVVAVDDIAEAITPYID